MEFQILQAGSFTILDQPLLLALSINLVGRNKIAKFPVILGRDEDGFIVASCPAFPGCHTQGRTREEAIGNIIEAIQGYMASLRKHGEPIPVTEVEVGEVEVVV